MKNLISVIVPVYNVAAYLPECLDSIRGQDYEKLEVILIDDGSADDSGAICDQYAAMDSRFRVIHQKNGGAASAKNAGLRIATGEYLSFVDSDDVLEPNVYGYMLGILKEYEADAAEFAFRDLYRNKTEDHIEFPQRKIVTGKEYMVRFTQSWTSALLWNKLYKRSLFDGIFFEEGHKIDDEYFTYQGMMNAKTVVCDNRIMYSYRRRASSVMASPAARTQRMIDRIDAMAKRQIKVAEKMPELREVFDTEFVDSLIYMMNYPDNTLESIHLLKTKLKAYLRQKGRTIPPRHFWKGIAKLYFTPAEKLLAECLPQKPEDNLDAYF